MYITSITYVSGKRKQKYQVRLDNGTDFHLYSKELQRFDLRENEELTKEQYEALLTEIFFPRAKKRALHLLEKQDRTTADLSRKLKQSGYPPEAIDVALDYVASYHYTDDLRYAKNHVRFHQHQKSRRRILHDLLQKGIDKETVEIALEEYQVDERIQIRSLLQKKGYDASLATTKEKDRMYRFLASRGYCSEDISREL